MSYILGVITGLLISSLILFIELYLWHRGQTLLDKATETVRKINPKQAEVIAPPTPQQEALARLYNNEKEINIKIND